MFMLICFSEFHLYLIPFRSEERNVGREAFGAGWYCRNAQDCVVKSNFLHFNLIIFNFTSFVLVWVSLNWEKFRSIKLTFIIYMYYKSSTFEPHDFIYFLCFSFVFPLLLLFFFCRNEPFWRVFVIFPGFCKAWELQAPHCLFALL